MIPEFQKDGNLPKGLYKATLHEVREVFGTGKDFPQDIDLLLIMRGDFNLDANPPDVKRVFDYVQGRIAFNADIFWTKSSIREEAIGLWIETYQMTRDFESRGIVEVTINDKE